MIIFSSENDLAMKCPILLILIFLIAKLACAQEARSTDWQLNTSVLPLPVNKRTEATILGYNTQGMLTTLRQGSNEMVCLADDPKKDGFSVACYHKELEPFMKRGRALKVEGKSAGEVFEIREQEVKSGVLKMPDKATLFVLTGEMVVNSNEIRNQYLRYVIYIPYATSESTGLPDAPQAPGTPWIMDPGTHRAHIMISPPKKK